MGQDMPVKGVLVARAAWIALVQAEGPSGGGWGDRQERMRLGVGGVGMRARRRAGGKKGPFMDLV